MCATSETDENMMPNNDIDSPTADDANSTGSGGVNSRLKKGPWTSAEDAILVEYVTRHGEGNWNAVQKHTGLARCGKSCRLRWANHLRPDLKKGAFTPEEEHLIIELHAKMGNKWARMAAELPGRTDNEIKNYWNTRIKRRQRAGLPVYPPEISLQALDESQHKHNTTTFSSGEAHSRDLMGLNNFNVPAIQFKNLELNQPVYSPQFPDISPTNGYLQIPGLHSSYQNKSLLSTMHPSKRLRGSEVTYHDSSQYQGGGYVHNGQPFVYSSLSDHTMDPYQLSSSSVLNGSHAIINGNPSSSEPTWVMKQELPSLQTQAENWCSPSSPLPPLESADTLIRTPPTENNLPHQLSSQNSGLLDAVLTESHIMKNPGINTSDFLHDSSMAVNVMDASSQLEPYGELTSPLGYSSSSLFSEGTPISGNSISEHEAMTGFRVRENASIWDQARCTKNGETISQIFNRPDYVLASDFLGPEKDSS